MFAEIKLTPVKIFFIFVLILVAVQFNTWQFLVESFMRYQLRNQYIAVGFTTTPYRIDKLQKLINQLIQQNVHIDQIYLSVPYKFKRDNLEYEIPEYLANNKKINILRTEDYGPGTKLLGMLEKVKFPANSIIITVDDDISYPKNLVLHLAYKHFKNPNQAIGLRGAEPDYDIKGILKTDTELGFKRVSDKEQLVTLLLGFPGVAFNSNFFDESVFDIKDYPLCCIQSDDLFFSFYLARKKISRSNLWNRYITPLKIDWRNEMGLDENALHRITRTSIKYKDCLLYMKAMYPEVQF